MSNDKKTILLLASNTTQDLELSEEFRDIKEYIGKSKNRDSYDIRLAGATRYKDLQQEIEKYTPHIVHISGHGVKNGIFLQDDKKMNSLFLVKDYLPYSKLSINKLNVLFSILVIVAIQQKLLVKLFHALLVWTHQ